MENLCSPDDFNCRFGSSFSGRSCYKYPPFYEKAMFTEQCTTVYRPLSSQVVLQPATRILPQPSHTETPTHIERRTHDQCVVIQQKSRRLLMMDVLMSETY